MPTKNRPKRLNRNISWRVARRKKRIAKLVIGNSRNRAPRPKKKKVKTETKPIETKPTPVEKKTVKKVIKKTVKKVIKK